MAQYTGYQSVLNAALGSYRDQGFRLEEPDDHLLDLFHHDKCVGVFSQSGATIQAVRDRCREHLESLS